MVLLLVISLLAMLGPSELEKGWKGIRVFESTRNDVERVFGRRVGGNSVEALYKTKEADIHVLYSTGSCINTRTLTGGFRAREETVLEYEVIPTTTLYLKDLKIREKLYERFEDANGVGAVEYYSNDYAIRISASLTRSGERINSISFGRTEKQKFAFECGR